MHLCLRRLLLMQVFFYWAFRLSKFRDCLAGKLGQAKAKDMKNCCLTTPHHSCYCRFHTLHCTHSHAEREREIVYLLLSSQ
jgi:hypothetical protein